MVLVKDEGFSPNAMKILRTRYFMKNEKGEFIDKKPSDLFRRVADYIASAEKTKEEQKKWADRFFEAMMARDFMPNSPTLTGAGRNMCLSACFVLPIEDSMESIFDAVKNAALVHKEGGGTGFDFSLLRPKGSFVRKTQGVASGPISFLKVIDAATEAVKQGGTRRGANIGLLRVDHPDIEEFVTMKRDGKTLNNFNISVAITDEFMKALKHDGEYWLYNPYLKKKTAKRKARDIFKLIVESAWAVGDPGLIFIDRINQLNPTRELGPISATNPCGEQPLHPYESCNLGSINVSNFYSPDHPDEIDWEKLATSIEMAVRFLDNVIDVNKYPLPQIAEMTKANRRIGLGIMGWADLLLKKKIRYDSPEALALAEKLLSFMRQTADRESEKLGELKGNFPNIDLSIFKGKKRRHATVLTIAPTGTISRIAGCSSSIEPIFAFEFVSKILDGEIKDVHPLYEEWKKEHPEEPLPDYFVTAHDIPYEGHIRMQAAFQKYVDNSVSKTINLPNQATFEDIEKAYLLAYDLGTKGITIYRDGSKAEQVLYAGVTARQKLIPRERPVSLPSITDKIKTGLGNLYVTITFLGNKPFEVFTSIGKSGYSTMADAEAIGRLISLALRSGVDPKEVILQLKGIGGSEPVFTEGSLVQSIPDAVAKVLERHLGEVKENRRDFLKDTCPMCGATLPDEKCPVCPNCGWTRCS
ncbi:MAG TPA: adenosylcobalamin-dependent ribonucleoside-diphosphate reductase [Candidatus Saccharicenans sp.]|jgi:ribonucleoside-diphosphate reductase alpha chain|nr:adenosylcobalamin-dependent ribonucleoside-diphosphate reductase [Candidatus Saccharicenans sp.]HRD01787.1 adenosylcobalamin-dependent ribonucleoside-diphosphate reductase [Candidatus Saccharicenans sp.]